MASILKVDKLDPQSGTDLEIGTSGDTINIPSGVTIANAGTATGFGAVLTGSTNNTVTTVTAANAISGETNLTFDGTDLTLGTGNVVIGTSGKGIDFSATADSGGTMTSELFDDYEEGTFTPTIGGAGSDPTVSFTTQTGNYTKIGNVVKVDAKIVINTISSGGGNFNSRGLPFTAVTRGCGSMIFSYIAVQAGGAVGVTPYVEATGTYLAFAEMNDAIDEALAHLQVNDLANGTFINYSASYRV